MPKKPATSTTEPVEGAWIAELSQEDVRNLVLKDIALPERRVTTPAELWENERRLYNIRAMLLRENNPRLSEALSFWRDVAERIVRCSADDALGLEGDLRRKGFRYSFAPDGSVIRSELLGDAGRCNPGIKKSAGNSASWRQRLAKYELPILCISLIGSLIAGWLSAYWIGLVSR